MYKRTIERKRKRATTKLWRYCNRFERSFFFHSSSFKAPIGSGLILSLFNDVMRVQTSIVDTFTTVDPRGLNMFESGDKPVPREKIVWASRPLYVLRVSIAASNPPSIPSATLLCWPENHPSQALIGRSPR